MNIPRADWVDFTYVCEDHVRAEDINEGTYRRTLKITAVPLVEVVQEVNLS